MTEDHGPRRWTSRLVLSGAGAVVLLGLTGLVGWLVGSSALVQVRDGLAPMQANTGVALVLAGLGVGALALGRRWTAAALGTAVGVIAGVSFAQYLFGVDLGIDQLLFEQAVTTRVSHPGRMAPETALALVLAGVGLAASRKGAVMPAFLGTLVSTVGAAWLLGYAVGYIETLDAASYGQMALHSAVALVLLGASLLLAAAADPRWPRLRPPWAPFLIGALVTLATLVLWRALDVRWSLQVEEVVATTARGVEREVEDRLEAMSRALQHLREHGQGARWRSTRDWQSHAQLTLGAFPSFEVIHWIDGEADRRAMFGESAWDEERARRLIDAPRFRRAVERAEATAGPVFAGPFPGRGGALFQIVLPPPEPWDGYLAAAFSAERAFRVLAHSIAPGYRISIATEDGRLFVDGPEVGERGSRWAAATRLRLPGSGAWELEVAPGPAVVANLRSALPEVVLGAGLLIALLLTATLRYGELAAARADELEAMVRRRTVELEEALGTIREENRERRRTEATLRRFLITLGHELRNPLGSIVTALEVLDLDPEDPDKDRQMRQIVGRQAAHLGRLVDDLLDVSRIEQGKVALRTERLDLVPLVREVAESQGAAVAAAGIALEIELPPEPVWVEADGTRLVQVVGNLLSNSTKFTDPGGRIVLALDRSAGEAVVTIRDTGCGLEPDELETVFEPFAQLDEAQRRMSGGLGLGLPIVKGLVDAHGGRLVMTSGGHGRGTEARVYLPSAPEPAALAEPAEARPAPPGAGDRVEPCPLRILLIDDHRDSADGLAELLRIQGHRVEVVYDGERGLDAAAAGTLDLVISDLGLPGLDGYEVARTLRSSGATRGLRLVALSGYGDRASIDRAREAGFDHHLSKPVDPAALTAVLRETPASGRV